MFVVSLHYVCEIQEVEQHLEDHVAFLDREYANGTFLASGRKNPRTGGVILARAESQTQLESILTQDPFYQHGLAEYEITEFVPTRTSAELRCLLEA